MEFLEGYVKLDNGVIKQSEYSKINYNFAYNNNYNLGSYKEKSKILSSLRLGVLLGSLGKIPNKILDVGYGNGDFLDISKNIIKECHGIDLSDYPVPDGCKKIYNMFEEKYDVVCFFDSLEHFDDIYSIRDLKTDYIFISVPWCHYHNSEWFLNWHHRKPNEHLWHFNEESLKNFFKEINYECIYTSNYEDIVRKNEKIFPDKNILSCLFKKK